MSTRTSSPASRPSLRRHRGLVAAVPLFAPLVLAAIVDCGSSVTGGPGTGGTTSASSSAATGGSTTTVVASSSTGNGGATTASTSSGTGGATTASSSATTSSSSSSSSSSGSGGTGGSTTTSTSTTSTTSTASSSSGIGVVDAGVVCGGDLSGIGTGDFQISFTIQTTQTDSSFSVLSQRDVCSAGNFWDIHASFGDLVLETDSLTDGGADDASLSLCSSINDGTAHRVVVQRVAGVLSGYVDDHLEPGTQASTASWGTLPALSTGTDACVGVDGTVVFDTTVGSITDVCISTTTQTQPDLGAGSCD